MKRFLAALTCVLLLFSLTGCGASADPIVDENGDVIHYTEEEIEQGYYILKDDGFYYKILNMEGDTDNNGNVYLWFTEPYDAAIPRFSTKDKLLFYNETDRPSSITLYKMTDYGYTLGIMFNVTTEEEDLKHPVIIGFGEKYNPYSLVEGVVTSAVTENATTYITGINNHEFTSTLLVDDSFLKGLTKDTMYQLEMYCGTVRKTVNIKADTHLFLQESTYVTSSYEELKDKCFKISLPSNLAPGYYFAEGVGIFYYEGTIQDIDEDEIESMINTDETTSTEEGATTENTEIVEPTADDSEEVLTDLPVENTEPVDANVEPLVNEETPISEETPVEEQADVPPDGEIAPESNVENQE